MALLDPISITVTRSDNASKSFSGRPANGEAFGITELVGFEFPEVEVFTSPKGLGDGVFFTGQRLNGRTVEIHLKQNERYPDDFYLAWQLLKNFFNPAHTFTLQVDYTPYTGLTQTRYLNDCRILAAEYHMINASEPNPELIVQMMSPDPFFEEASWSEQIVYTDNVAVTYTYLGDYKARPHLIFDCTSSNGSLSFDVTMNGVTWQVSTPTAIAVGDRITLDPETMGIGVNAPPSPSLVGVANDIYDAWWLNPGTNANTFTIDGNGCTFDFFVSYIPRYLGI